MRINILDTIVIVYLFFVSYAFYNNYNNYYNEDTIYTDIIINSDINLTKLCAEYNVTSSDTHYIELIKG